MAGRAEQVKVPAQAELLPTVAQTLAFESLRRGRAEVVAGHAGLEARVRWVHVSELPTIAEALRGGELLVTTGIALPQEPTGLTAYVRDLARAGAAGIVVGLGPRFVDELPPALLRAADHHGLPLAVLRRFTRFIEITEDVHSRIVDIQMEELRISEQIHATFTELTVEGIGLQDVVHQVATMAGCPVVLENLVHHVLAYDAAGLPPDEVIADWESRSRAVRVPGRTGHDRSNDWLVSSVGARGRDWGRLVLVSPPGPSKRMEMLVERAASTLALGRLLERDSETLELHVQGTLLSGLLSPTQPTKGLALEAKAVGVALEGRRIIGVALRLRPTDVRADVQDAVQRQRMLRTLAEAATAAARAGQVQALVGIVDAETVAVLLSLPMNIPDGPALTRWVDTLRGQPGLPAYVVGVGPSSTRVAEIRAGLLEATQVADAAQQLQEDRPFFRGSDLRLRGLLRLLRDDTRLQVFAEQELGPLLVHDQQHGTTLVALLRSYLECGRNKTAAAEQAHVSRPWMYERLARVERILDVSLDSEDTCVSLQVALMALEAMQ